MRPRRRSPSIRQPSPASANPLVRIALRDRRVVVQSIGGTSGGRMAEDWKTDVIAGVERWNVVAGGGSRAAWFDLGAAAPRDDGWLVLDLRDRRAGSTYLDPCFAGGQGPERERAHPV